MTLTKRTAEVRKSVLRRLRKAPFGPFFLILSDGWRVPVWGADDLNVRMDGRRRSGFETWLIGGRRVKWSEVTYVAPLTVTEAIRYAETLLPGKPARKGSATDPRWQAIILLGEFIRTEPHAVWEFIKKWGRYRQNDLAAAIHCCLLEHLLEYHFIEFFPKVRKLALESTTFAEIAVPLKPFRSGQAAQPSNSRRLDRLDKRLQFSRAHRRMRPPKP